MCDCSLTPTTANVLRPGDKVLVCATRDDVSMEAAQQMQDRLHENFPGVEFTIAVGVDALIIQPADAVG